ncbi:hypothetical protein ACET3Z_015225 [Daucus carota]
MKFPGPFTVSYLFFLILVIHFGAQGNKNQLTGPSLNQVDLGKYKALCGEKDVECKQGGEKGARREEKVFENEDYIYTQSVP